MNRTLIATIVLLIATITSALTAYTNPSGAANAGEWRAGNIIDDNVFTDDSSMSVADIQAFLDSKIGTCDTWGTGTATEFGYGGTRAQYAAANGWPAPPYTCLNIYYEVPKTEPSANVPANNYSNPSSIPAGAQSAAWIIKDAATRYNISPKVLLVKIGTESAGPLTSDKWPLFSQYRYAMGAHCPDSGPGGSANCDPNYSGFSMQIYEAAKLLRTYLTNMDQPWWGYIENGVKVQHPSNREYGSDPGGGYKVPNATNFILWNVRARGCGGQNIFIDNKATAALYTYTPYQPNQAALNNLYGTGDNCSAYGNRNFWRVFTDWFGSTKISFTSLDNPRYMRIKDATKRVGIKDGQPFGDDIAVGTQAYFVDKIFAYGHWYARTEYAKNTNQLYGIPVDDIEDIPITSITPRWISLPSTTKKVNPLTRQEFETIEALSATRVVESITVDGVLYYRTEWEKSVGRERFIRASDTENFTLYDFAEPRGMVATRDTLKVNMQTGTAVSSISKGAILYFNKKITINGKLYAQKQSDNGTINGTLINDLSEINTLSIQFTPLENPRYMQTSNVTKQFNLQAGQFVGEDMNVNSQAYFVDKIFAYGQWYARTEEAKKNSQLIGIPVDNLQDIPAVSITPRWISIPADVVKVNPLRRELFETIQGASATRVVDSIIVNGIPYYRTQWENSVGRPYFIPVSSTEDFRFYNFVAPRAMVATRNTTKVNVQTGATIASIPSNSSLFFNRLLTVDGRLYAQAQADNGTLYGILASDLR